MFERNGEKLGSVQIDPSSTDPQKRKTAKAKVVETPPEPPAVSETPAPAAEPPAEPPPAPESPPEPEPKKAPAKKAAGAFKSALDKPKG